MECLAKAGFEDDFVKFYNQHIGTACDGSGVGLKISDEFGELTFCNGIVKTEDGVISCTIDIRVPVTFKKDDILNRIEGIWKIKMAVLRWGKSVIRCSSQENLRW